jgi:hypothetical protein
MTASKSSKSSLITLVQAFIAGINTEMPNVQTFPLEGQSIPRATLLGLFQSFLDADAKSTSANTAWRSAASAEQALVAQIRPLAAAFKGALQSQYGKASPELLKFGIAPTRPRSTTVAAKMVGVVKGASTRVERKTMSKKQKQEIVGQVPATIQVSTGPGAKVTVEPSAPSPAAPVPPAAAAGPTNHT